MTFRFTESRGSRGGSDNPPTETRVYTASGSNNRDYVQAYALGASPAFVSNLRGTLYRQDVQVDPVGFEQWKVTVPYAQDKRDAGQMTIDFDTSGGTLRITNSLSTISKYQRPGAAAAPDMGGAIGVKGDDVEGAEIIIPALKISVNFTHPAGIITLAQIKNLARWTGRTNSTPFLTFAAGEVLFLGATGKEGTDSETSVGYQFAMSENSTGQTIGDIVNVAKKGWEYAWIGYEDHDDDALPAKRPRWVYIEQVYRTLDMATALGFGA